MEGMNQQEGFSLLLRKSQPGVDLNEAVETTIEKVKDPSGNQVSMLLQ
jgi:hypothetical protein